MVKAFCCYASRRAHTARSPLPSSRVARPVLRLLQRARAVLSRGRGRSASDGLCSCAGHACLIRARDGRARVRRQVGVGVRPAPVRRHGAGLLVQREQSGHRRHGAPPVPRPTDCRARPACRALTLYAVSLCSLREHPCCAPHALLLARRAVMHDAVNEDVMVRCTATQLLSASASDRINGALLTSAKHEMGTKIAWYTASRCLCAGDPEPPAHDRLLAGHVRRGRARLRVVAAGGRARAARRLPAGLRPARAGARGRRGRVCAQRARARGQPAADQPRRVRCKVCGARWAGLAEERDAGWHSSCAPFLGKQPPACLGGLQLMCHLPPPAHSLRRSQRAVHGWHTADVNSAGATFLSRQWASPVKRHVPYVSCAVASCSRACIAAAADAGHAGRCTLVCTLQFQRTVSRTTAARTAAHWPASRPRLTPWRRAEKLPLRGVAGPRGPTPRWSSARSVRPRQRVQRLRQCEHQGAGIVRSVNFS